MYLTQPSLSYKNEYLAAYTEQDIVDKQFYFPLPEGGESFESFTARQIDQSYGRQLPANYVPSTELWLIDNKELIGRTNIRHVLNDWLLEIGGHIGYWIRPSKRNQGYGTQILKLALDEAKKLGIDRVLVTCDEDNEGSRKIIEANGGVLENIVPNGPDNPMKRRYWISQ